MNNMADESTLHGVAEVGEQANGGDIVALGKETDQSATVNKQWKCIRGKYQRQSLAVYTNETPNWDDHMVEEHGYD